MSNQELDTYTGPVWAKWTVAIYAGERVRVSNGHIFVLRGAPTVEEAAIIKWWRRETWWTKAKRVCSNQSMNWPEKAFCFCFGAIATLFSAFLFGCIFHLIYR